MVACGAGILLVISLILIPFGWGVSIADAVTHRVKILQVVVVGFWTLVPPIWFWFEYFWVRPRLPSPPPAGKGPTFEEFKYGQDVSSKLWIAATSALLILYFWKDLRH